MTHPLATVQKSLGDAARIAWDAIEKDLRARPPLVHAPGARLVFVGLDPTIQLQHHIAGRCIVLRHGHERFLFPLEGKLAKKIGELRNLQTLFGWPIARETAWNLVADITESRELEPVDPEKIDPNAPTIEHELTIRELYVPGQILLAEGFDASDALAALERALPPIAVPTNASPAELVALLPKILASHHWRAFEGLCDRDVSGADRRMAFEQFRQAWTTAGAIAFDGYEGQPESTPEGGVVRTKIRRAGSKPGEVLVRPLLWVRRDGGWRFAGGIL